MASEEKGVIRTISKLHLQKAEKVIWNTTRGSAEVFSGKEMRVYGKNGGVIFKDYFEVKNVNKMIEVLQIEGPFNAHDEITTYLSRKGSYYYLTTLNQKLTLSNIKNVKWAVTYDDDKTDRAFYLFSGGKIENGKIRIDIKINKGVEKFKVYAYIGDILGHVGYAEGIYKKVVVFFIGGAGDVESFTGLEEKTNIVFEQVSKPFENDIYSKFPNVKKQYISKYLGYKYLYGDSRIQKNVISVIPNIKGTTIYIVGHSLGGWNGAHLSQILTDKGYFVCCLITLDPVGTKVGVTWVSDIYRSYPQPKCQFWIDIYTKPENTNADDGLAWAGGQWIPDKTIPFIFHETKFHHGSAGKMFYEFIPAAERMGNTTTANCLLDFIELNL